MAANNYFGFAHGGAQYGAAATGAAYPAAQPGYAVTPAATAATYGTQRAASTAYDTAAYQAAATQGTYATTGAPTTYDYGYGRAATTYDASKTYYQQAGATAVAGYTAPAYDANAAKPAYQTTVNYTTQAAAPRQNTNQTAKAQYVAATQQTYAQAPAAATQTTYQTNNQATAAQKRYPKKSGQGNQGGIGGHKSQRPKQPPKPQQLHYCDVCRISCAGPQTYREHLEGQKHKKREASLKLVATVTNVSQGRAGNALRCELCDVTCTGNDAYAAHVRGAKHQKVVKLHTKLGKPIPSQEPQVLGKKSSNSGQKINFVASGSLGASNAGSTSGATEENSAEMETDVEPDIQPVGQDYIEEMKGDDGKVLSFNCKLCDCRFNDPNAKEMHMKGRRHRLQYKKKVQPDLVVDVKPSLRQRKLQEAKVQRAAMREEFWARRRMAESEMEEEERIYWEERRRYEDECDYLEWCRRGPAGPFPGPPRPPMMGRPGPMGPMPPFFGMSQQGPRRPDSSDDKHVLAKHAEIYPKEEELQVIQRIVSHTERALKFVSDALADQSMKTNTVRNSQQTLTKPTPGLNKTPPGNEPAVKLETKPEKESEAKKDDKKDSKEDGRDNQLFSFHRDADTSTVRVLKGVMRVGLLAKGLLLQGDNNVQLVVLCAEKPTSTLLKKVFQELPIQLKKVTEEHKYKVSLVPIEAGITISDGNVTVLVSLTSPLMREQG
uniref:Putative transcription factor nfat subunit nf90 n=1 Tax=Xenopsylla cheopis TaxID=163159 RepID=A0A6M2DPB1_XENCH